MATMQQARTATREFTREFEQYAQDMCMAKEDAKFHLVSALNQNTFTHLDAYITMCGSNKMAHLETIQDWLCCIPYVQMLAYLKWGELSELAR